MAYHLPVGSGQSIVRVAGHSLEYDLDRTEGTFSLSTWEAAASVVTVLTALVRRGWNAALLTGAENTLGANLESIV